MGTAAERIVAIALLAAYATLGVTFARHASPTWDEVPTFAQGLYLLREGRWDIPGTINHPPLSFYLQSLPLLFVGLDEGDAWDYRRMPADPAMRLLWRGIYDLPRGWDLLYRNAPRFPEDHLTFLTRMPTLALGLATAIVLYRWSRRLHGAGGGLLTLALFCLSPSYIAHGALATTDMAMMLFTTAAAFAWWRACEAASPARAALAGALLGLGLLSKYTALLLAAPFAALLAPLVSRGKLPARRAAVLLLVLALAAAATLTLGYQGRLDAFRDGVEYQRINVKHGQMGFLAGEKRMNGWWYYYPFVMAVKTPLPELLLAAAGGLLWLRRDRLSPRLLFATVPFVFLLAFFVFKRLPVGLRHVLPVYPALLLAAGAVAATGGPRPRLRAVVIAGLLAWLGASLARIHPHEISYFNETVGGADRGTDYLLDSNSDWGQDLKDLRTWMRVHGAESIQLGYFGTADPAYYGIRYRPLPSFALRQPFDPRSRWPPRGLMAVSASCYGGLAWQGENPYAFLHQLTPIGRAGHSILIFDVP